MVELSKSCCTPTAQETCCEPAEKGSCYGETHVSRCGCAAGAGRAKGLEVRETVREKYAAAAPPSPRVRAEGAAVRPMRPACSARLCISRSTRRRR